MPTGSGTASTIAISQPCRALSRPCTTAPSTPSYSRPSRRQAGGDQHQSMASTVAVGRLRALLRPYASTQYTPLWWPSLPTGQRHQPRFPRSREGTTPTGSSMAPAPALQGPRSPPGPAAGHRRGAALGDPIAGLPAAIRCWSSEQGMRPSHEGTVPTVWIEP